MSWFIAGGPGKEHRTNRLPPTRRVQERSKEDITCSITSQNPSRWFPSWLSNACATRKDWVRMIGQRTRKLIPSPQNPRLRATWKSSSPGFPYPITLHPGTFSNKILFLALSAGVSPQIIHLRVLDRSPLLGPGRGPPSCKKGICFPWKAPS